MWWCLGNKGFFQVSRILQSVLSIFLNYFCPFLYSLLETYSTLVLWEMSVCLLASLEEAKGTSLYFIPHSVPCCRATMEAIREKWASLRGRAALDCVRIYLNCVRKWPLCGARLFPAKVKPPLSLPFFIISSIAVRLEHFYIIAWLRRHACHSENVEFWGNAFFGFFRCLTMSVQNYNGIFNVKV